MANKKKNRTRRGQQTTIAGTEPGDDQEGGAVGGGDTPEAAPRRVLTVPERLFSKASAVYEMVKDVMTLAEKRGAPAEVVSQLASHLVDAGAWRDVLKALLDGGWQPQPSREMKDLQVGDKVAVVADHADLYSFIPEGAELVVDEISRSQNGRIKGVLLKDIRGGSSDEGLASDEPRTYGWAQLSHLERR